MNTLRKFIDVPVLACCLAASAMAAEPAAAKDPASPRKSVILARGKYLVTLGGCHDCHTPKLMTEKGPALDTKRLLSGFPASEKTPAVPEGAIGPKSWGGLFTGDLTGWAGPSEIDGGEDGKRGLAAGKLGEPSGMTPARGQDRNAGHLEGGPGSDPAFHGSVAIAKSDLPRRR